MEQNHTQPEPADDVAEVFEALRRDVTMMHAAVEGLTAARERVPDYSLSLAQIFEALKNVASTVDRLERSPVARLSPVSFAAEINKAAAEARAEDRAILQQYRDTMSNSIGRIDGIVQRGHAADVQLGRLIWTGVGCLLLGCFFWSILPGAIARSLPASWHVPEWMAARTMDMDQRDAGARLIATAPEDRSSKPDGAPRHPK